MPLIKISRFNEVYPGDPLGTPVMRSHLLAHIGADYFRLCRIVRDRGPLGMIGFGVLIPLQQQTIELLVKSIAFRHIPAFEPRKYGHNTLEIVDAYAGEIPVFAALSRSEARRQLISELTDGYLAVRYGEAHVTYDQETWREFSATAEELIAITASRSGGLTGETR